jgi:ABC-type multidrug transport system permease subunit
MVFERLFIAILTAALAAVFAFVVLAGPYIENSQQAALISPGEISAQGAAISARESAEKLKAYIIDAGQRIKHAGLQMPMYHWAIIMVLALIFIVAGFSLWRLAMALCCSLLGTILIFAGMILLLLHKGAVPVSIICSKSSYYATAFIVMTAFGTAEQLLLCKRQKTRSTGKRQMGKNRQEPSQTKGSWRTS